MILSVGRVIHVVNKSLEQCVAAIVTSVGEDIVHVTLFPPHGPISNTVSRDYVGHNSDSWHDPRECPNA